MRSRARNASQFGPIQHYLVYSGHTDPSNWTTACSQVFLCVLGSLRKPKRGSGCTNMLLRCPKGPSKLLHLLNFTLSRIFRPCRPFQLDNSVFPSLLVCNRKPQKAGEGIWLQQYAPKVLDSAIKLHNSTILDIKPRISVSMDLWATTEDCQLFSLFQEVFGCWGVPKFEPLFLHRHIRARVHSIK